MIDRHLHDVVASDSLEIAESTPEDVPNASALSPTAAEEDSKDRPHAAAPQAESSPPQAHATESAPQVAHDGRTWVTKWMAGQHSQTPLTGWQAPGSTDASILKSGEKGGQLGRVAGAAGLREGTVHRQGSNGTTDQGSPAATHGAGDPDHQSRGSSSSGFAAVDSRAAICMHPGAHRAAQVSGGPAEHAARAATANSTAALEPARATEPVAVLPEAPAQPQPNLGLPSESRQGGLAAGANGSSHPVPSNGSVPPQASAAPSSNTPAVPANRNGVGEIVAAGTGGSSGPTECGPGVLAAACMPFEDAGARAWYCCDLFGVDGGSAPGLPFASTPMARLQTLGTGDEVTVAQQALQGAPLSPALRRLQPPVTCVCQARCVGARPDVHPA